jgi:hypothetical protein
MGWFNLLVLAEDIVDDDEEKPSGRHYTEKDAARDTDTTTSKVAKSWHDARDDEEEAGYITRTRNR